ncbi:MAG: hypothetical protein ABSG46_06380 [Candidatus Binataceae bacterium]
MPNRFAQIPAIGVIALIRQARATLRQPSIANDIRQRPGLAVYRPYTLALKAECTKAPFTHAAGIRQPGAPRG